MDLINNKDLVKILINQHLIVEYAKENINITKQFLEKKVFFNHLRLILTTNCNFKCRYCTFKSNGDLPNKRMNFEIAKKAIDLFFNSKNQENEPGITLYGGEPLLEQNLIRKIVKYIRKQEYSSIPIGIISNGSLISDDFCKFLKKYEVKITISIDGLEEMHDEMRVSLNGKGTFRDVMKGISLLNKNNLDFACSCTIGSHNLNSLNKIVDFFQNKCNLHQGLFPYVQFGAPNSQDPKAIANALINAFESNKSFKFIGLFNTIQRVINKTQKVHYAFNCVDELDILPNGDISLCHRLGIQGKCILANVLQRDPLKTIINSNFYDEIIKRSPFIMPECSNCECLGICGGGCYMNAYIKNQSFSSRDPYYCNYIKTILNWILRKIIENTNL